MGNTIFTDSTNFTEPEETTKHIKQKYNIDSLETNSFPKYYKEVIFNKLVLPYYAHNIEYEIKTKDGWSKVSVAFLSLSTFLIGGSSLLSFACGFYPNNFLNFAAGSIGLLSIIFKEFATYANSIDHIKTLTLNELLKNIDINHSFFDSSSNYKMAIDRKNSQGGAQYNLQTLEEGIIKKLLQNGNIPGLNSNQQLPSPSSNQQLSDPSSNLDETKEETKEETKNDVSSIFVNTNLPSSSIVNINSVLGSRL
jgi:hypothetical protein